MNRAVCMIRDQPVYRREAFVSGLRAAGFDVCLHGDVRQLERGDVLLIWNRYGQYHDAAVEAEKREAQVLVAENAYLGIDRADRQRYALANHGHNGSGAWYFDGTPSRWEELGITLQPWRKDGDHILVAPNRSFGMPGFIMPPNWADDVASRLRKVTKREIRVRPHPGNGPPKRPLIDDLRGAWAVVIWSSSVGCEALVSGIPVFCEAPWWIAKGAASRGGIKTIDDPELPDRGPAFHRLAWAQWHVEEIKAGEPFQHLLNRPQAFAGGL